MVDESHLMLYHRVIREIAAKHGAALSELAPEVHMDTSNVHEYHLGGGIRPDVANYGFQPENFYLSRQFQNYAAIRHDEFNTRKIPIPTARNYGNTIEFDDFNFSEEQFAEVRVPRTMRNYRPASTITTIDESTRQRKYASMYEAVPNSMKQRSQYLRLAHAENDLYHDKFDDDSGYTRYTTVLRDDNRGQNAYLHTNFAYHHSNDGLKENQDNDVEHTDFLENVTFQKSNLNVNATSDAYNRGFSSQIDDGYPPAGSSGFRPRYPCSRQSPGRFVHHDRMQTPKNDLPFSVGTNASIEGNLDRHAINSTNIPQLTARHQTVEAVSITSPQEGNIDNTYQRRIFARTPPKFEGERRTNDSNRRYNRTASNKRGFKSLNSNGQNDCNLSAVDRLKHLLEESNRTRQVTYNTYLRSGRHRTISTENPEHISYGQQLNFDDFSEPISLRYQMPPRATTVLPSGHYVRTHMKNWNQSPFTPGYHDCSPESYFDSDNREYHPPVQSKCLYPNTFRNLLSNPDESSSIHPDGHKPPSKPLVSPKRSRTDDFVYDRTPNLTKPSCSSNVYQRTYTDPFSDETNGHISENPPHSAKFYKYENRLNDTSLDNVSRIDETRSRPPFQYTAKRAQADAVVHPYQNRRRITQQKKQKDEIAHYTSQVKEQLRYPPDSTGTYEENIRRTGVYGPSKEGLEADTPKHLSSITNNYGNISKPLVTPPDAIGKQDDIYFLQQDDSPTPEIEVRAPPPPAAISANVTLNFKNLHAPSNSSFKASILLDTEHTLHSRSGKNDTEKGIDAISHRAKSTAIDHEAVYFCRMNKAYKSPSGLRNSAFNTSQSAAEKYSSAKDHNHKESKQKCSTDDVPHDLPSSRETTATSLGRLHDSVESMLSISSANNMPPVGSNVKAYSRTSSQDKVNKVKDTSLSSCVRRRCETSTVAPSRNITKPHKGVSSVSATTVLQSSVSCDTSERTPESNIVINKNFAGKKPGGINHDTAQTPNEKQKQQTEFLPRVAHLAKQRAEQKCAEKLQNSGGDYKKISQHNRNAFSTNDCRHSNYQQLHHGSQPLYSSRNPSRR